MNKDGADSAAAGDKQATDQAPAILEADRPTAAVADDDAMQECDDFLQPQLVDQQDEKQPKKGAGTLTRIKKATNIKMPKVAGQRITLERNVNEKADVMSRDPHGYHKDFILAFEDLIAEPDSSIYTFDCLFTLSYHLFTLTKRWSYRLLTLVCAIPLSIIFGCNFAFVSFYSIWCCRPYFKFYQVSLFYLQKYIELLLQVVYEPCFKALGQTLSKIAVSVRQE